MTKQLTINLSNVGPHQDTALTIQPGVNVLRGRNGAGKSTAIQAATAALSGGKTGVVSVRDGATTGQVFVDGVLVLQIGRRLTQAGQPTVELGSFSSIGELIDPNLKDPVAADMRRVKAILAMSPIPVDESVIAELTQGEQLPPPPPDVANNILLVAEHFRTAANKLALEEERRRDLCKAVVDARGADIAAMPPPAQTSFSVADADLMLQHAEREYTRTQLLAQQKLEKVERIARIAATLGPPPPTPEEHEERLRVANKNVEDATARCQALEAQLAAERAALAGFRQAAGVAQREHALAQSAMDRWQAQRAAVDEPVVGPSEEDVKAAEEALVAAKVRLEQARREHTRRVLQDEMGAQLVNMEAARDRAIRLRELAHGVSQRLGVILDRAGVGGFAIDDVEERPRLFYEMDGKRQLFAERLSFGQKARVALRIACSAFKGRFVPVDPAFWAGLQPSHQKELASIAREMEVMIVTEAPSDDDAISVEHA